MSLYFIGEGNRMAQVRDETLIAKMGYTPCCRKGDTITPACVRSPDGVFMIEFHPHQAKVCVEDKSLIHPDDPRQQRYTGRARPYLEQLRDLLQPDKILDFCSVDITETLGIQ